MLTMYLVLTHVVDIVQSTPYTWSYLGPMRGEIEGLSNTSKVTEPVTSRTRIWTHLWMQNSSSSLLRLRRYENLPCFFSVVFCLPSPTLCRQKIHEEFTFSSFSLASRAWNTFKDLAEQPLAINTLVTLPGVSRPFVEEKELFSGSQPWLSSHFQDLIMQ